MTMYKVFCAKNDDHVNLLDVIFDCVSDEHTRTRLINAMNIETDLLDLTVTNKERLVLTEQDVHENMAMGRHEDYEALNESLSYTKDSSADTNLNGFVYMRKA